MQQYKPLIASWSFWFGVVQIVSAGLGFLSGAMDQNQALTLAGTGISTIALRLKTNSGISGLTQ